MFTSGIFFPCFLSAIFYSLVDDFTFCELRRTEVTRECARMRHLDVKKCNYFFLCVFYFDLQDYHASTVWIDGTDSSSLVGLLDTWHCH